MEKEPITIEGFEKIKKELEELKNIKRPKIVEAIAEARGHGDLKENAEYHAAKEEQSKIESRIIEINDLIARANIIDVTKLEKKDNVVFGSTVQLIDLDTNTKKIYKIVGKDEADIKKNFIYFRSPMGKALIGKKKKEIMTVTTPSDEKKIYKIVGKDEADIKKNYIYFRSPIGKALIGKKKKELISVITPSGEKNFEITDVKYI